MPTFNNINLQTFDSWPNIFILLDMIVMLISLLSYLLHIYTALYIGCADLQLVFDMSRWGVVSL